MGFFFFFLVFIYKAIIGVQSQFCCASKELLSMVVQNSTQLEEAEDWIEKKQHNRATE